MLAQFPRRAAGRNLGLQPVHLLQQRAAMIQTIERPLRLQAGARERAVAIVGHAYVGIVSRVNLLIERFLMTLVGRAAEVGPDGVVLISQNRGIRPRARYFSFALRAEAERQGDVWR